MKTNRIFQHIMLAAVASVTALASQAQTFNSGYFTDGFIFQHEMNPAFGNERGYVSMPAIGNFNLKVQGNFGVGDVVMDNPMFPNGSNKRLTSFMNPYIDDASALAGFNKGANKLQFDVPVNILSVGFKGFGGYNTIGLSLRTSMGVSMPYELFEFARNIGNKTYQMDEISVAAQSFAQLAFGHSRQINDQLRVGAKMKLLFGAARADLKITNLTADLADNDQWRMTANAEGNISLKGLQLISGTEEYNNPENGTYETIDDVEVDGAGLGGFGLAFDLGAEYKINDDWRVSAALLDLGFISWSNNVKVSNDKNEFIFKGFQDISVNEDRDPNGTFEQKADDYADQLLDFANLSDQGDQGGRTTGIGATINAAVEYNLPVYRPLTFGFLSTTRLNGDFSWTEGRLSANYAPLKWIDGNVNVAVNTFGTSAGWLVNIHPRGFNFFVGMDHILGKMAKQGVPLSSKASFILGVNIGL